jgi:DNA-binding NtrC family response regulator
MALSAEDGSDRTRLLRIEIFLKLYVLLLLLCGYVLLEFLGALGEFGFPRRSLVTVLLLFALLNGYYLYSLRRSRRLNLLYWLVGLTDILFFTLVIHFLGGAGAPFLALLYVLPVPFFSILISPWSGYLVAIGSCVAYTLLCGFEYSGLLPYYGDQPVSLGGLGVVLIFLFFCFFSIAFYAGYFSDVLRRHQKALTEANREIEKQNQTLELRIAERTREIERAREKLEEYSRKLERAYEEQRTQLELVQKRLDTKLSELDLKYDYENIVGPSRPMQEVFRLMDKVTDFSVPVLIEGESGTGKDLVARAIHYNGPRKDKPFVIQNCSAIPDALLESELFGHMKGAFTGAHQDRKGLFEDADQGTLFLDEIADMSPTMQAKLLRAIQEGEIRPVGGSKMIRVDVRAISATNKNLKEAVEKGKFREDLFYRLNGVNIRLPPLRDRKEEILPLGEHFLRRFAEETGRGVKSLSPAGKRVLLSYSWPGNVRELENTIKNACVIAQGDQIEVEDFRYKPELFTPEGGVPPIWGGSPRETAREPGVPVGGVALPGLGGSKGPESGGSVLSKDWKPEVPGKLRLKDIEQEAIREALRSCDGRRKKAAEALGIPIRTLYEKLRRYGIR